MSLLTDIFDSSSKEGRSSSNVVRGRENLKILRAIGLSVRAFQTGFPVTLESPKGRCLSVFSAEEADLSDLEAQFDSNDQKQVPYLVLSYFRAQAIGLIPSDQKSPDQDLPFVFPLKDRKWLSFCNPLASLSKADCDAVRAERLSVDRSSLSLFKGGLLLSVWAERLPALLFFAPERAELKKEEEFWQSQHMPKSLHNPLKQTVLVKDIFNYEDLQAESLRLLACAHVPLEGVGVVRLMTFRPGDGSADLSVVLLGEPEKEAAPFVRLHSQCFTGDTLSSLKCDCGPQLHKTLQMMKEAGNGILLYLPQEGRGIGLGNKIRAYGLQEQGQDTIESNLALGFSYDERRFAQSVAILRLLKVQAVRLISANPEKVEALTSRGIQVLERQKPSVEEGPYNADYLKTKRERLGHFDR